MAIEDEIKFWIPTEVNPDTLVPPNPIPHQITQVYLSPEEAGIQIKKRDEGIEVTFTHLVSGKTEKLLPLNDPKERAVFEDLQSSDLGLLGEDGKIMADARTVMRIRTDSEQGFLTLKQKTHDPQKTNEFEFEIPVEAARRLQPWLQAAGTAKIEKHRRSWPVGESKYELDVFAGANKGLVVLEVENPPAAGVDPETIPRGAIDVTNDKRFGNLQLAKAPYSPEDVYWKNIGERSEGMGMG